MYQLNINSNIHDKDYGEEEYEIRGKYTGDILTEKFVIFSKNIEFYRDLYYTKGEKLDEGKMWFIVLSSKSYEEMYKAISEILDDREAIEFMKEVEKLNSDRFMLTETEIKALNKIQELDTIANAKEDKSIEIAKKLLENNIDIDIISSSTGLSKEKIEKLI